MLGLVLIYFIGKSFYTLAGDHNRSQWGFAILGVVTYYAGTIIGGVIIGVVMALNNPYADFDNPLLGIIAIPFGLLAWWGLHALLKKNWSKTSNLGNDAELLDDVLIDD